MQSWSVICVLITKNMQVGTSSDWGDTATAKGCLALVVAAIPDCGQTNHQPTTKIPDPCIDHDSVFPPSDAHFNKGSKGKGGEKKIKKAENVGLIQTFMLFQG